MPVSGGLIWPVYSCVRAGVGRRPVAILRRGSPVDNGQGDVADLDQSHEAEDPDDPMTESPEVAPPAGHDVRPGHVPQVMWWVASFPQTQRHDGRVFIGRAWHDPAGVLVVKGCA